MEQDTNKIEQTGAGVEKIRTKLKFIKSEKNGALISFVSQNPVTDIVCGVRQDSPYPKKIVIIDREMAHNILVNVLYDCVLIPMTPVFNEKTGEKNHIPGYIAIEANPVQFKATVTTKYIRGIKYNVEVSFGNKVIRFDPFRGQKESLKSLPACRALNLLKLMKQDMRQIHNKRNHNEKAGRGNRH